MPLIPSSRRIVTTDAAGNLSAFILDKLPTGGSPVGHNHDDRYYTETETNNLLAGKANTAHTQASATITDLTETVQDIVGGLLVAGVNTTISYNDAAGTITINSTASGGGGGDGTDPEIVRDVIGAALVAGSGVQITYDDAADTITVSSTAVQPTRAITAGTGLTGGGNLSADRALAVDFTAVATAAQGAKADSASQPGHTHDDRYFTETEADGRFVRTVNGTGPDGTGNVTVSGGSTVASLDDVPDSATRLALTAAERTKLGNTSGTNTGDQVLPTWATIGGKPAVVAAGTDAAAARTAIGAGTSSLAIGTTGTTAKAGDYQPDWNASTGDAQILNKPTLGAAAAAGIGTAAGQVKPGDWAPAASEITNATAIGRGVITAATSSAARTAIGAGTSNLALGTTSATAKAGDWKPAWGTDIAGQPAIIAAGADAAAARAAISARREDWLDVRKFGAPLDGVGDDLPAINAAITAAAPGQTVYIPKPDNGGAWSTARITDTIYTEKHINLVAESEIAYAGPRDRPAIHFKGQHRCTIELNILTDAASSGPNSEFFAGWHGWATPAYVGLVVENTKLCDVKAEEIRNFTVGMKLWAKLGGPNASGCWFTDVRVKQMWNCLWGFEFCSDGYTDSGATTGGWCNSNMLYDTSFRYSSSGNFATAAVDRYCIMQTLTNGNQYGGNSNVFERLRFEGQAPAGGTFNMIYLRKALHWHFRNYRSEIFGQNLCVVDIGDTPVSATTMAGHSNNIHLYPAGVTSTPGAVKIINNKRPQTHYSEIVKVHEPLAPPRQVLFEARDLSARYRRVTNDRHIIRGLHFMSLTATTRTTADSAFATASDRLIDNGVDISNSWPIAVILDGMSVGDEIDVELFTNDGTAKSKPYYKPLDVAGSVLGEYVGDTRTLAYLGFQTGNYLLPTADGRRFTFTVNHTDVKSVVVMLRGQLSGFRISGPSSSAVLARRTSVAGMDRVEGWTYNAAPTLTTAGYWMPGDTVYNSNTATGQAYGWKLSTAATPVWESLGTRA